jgi:hypothetical protein
MWDCEFSTKEAPEEPNNGNPTAKPFTITPALIWTGLGRVTEAMRGSLGRACGRCGWEPLWIEADGYQGGTPNSPSGCFHPFGLLGFHPFGLLGFHPFGLLSFHPFGLLGFHPFGLLGFHPSK